MVTRIKMKVTPELSKRVQEIVFANGGKWKWWDAKISNTDEKYLYVDENKDLMWGRDIEFYKQQHDYKEVKAIDFIVSQGEQEWLPKYGEFCEFSNDEDFQDKYTKEFRGYLPRGDYNHVTTAGHIYRYCRPLTKTITIKGKEVKISLKEFEDLKQQLFEDLKQQLKDD